MLSIDPDEEDDEDLPKKPTDENTSTTEPKAGG